MPCFRRTTTSAALAWVGFVFRCTFAAERSRSLRSAEDGVFHSLSSKVAALESQISETELRNKQELAAHQLSYERKLKEARKANLQLAAGNMRLAQDVQDLRRSSKDLRKMAVQLQEDGHKWMDDWNALKGNLTTFLEFTSNTIAGFQQAERAPELNVLEDLSKQDLQIAANEAHQHRFDEIVKGKENLALLQVSMLQQTPKSILDMLEGGLEDLVTEKAAKEKVLLDKFKVLMQAERKRREALLSEQMTLTKQKEECLQLQERLRAAVKYLQQTNDRLEHQGRSLRMYTQRLGIRPLPNSPASNTEQPSALALLSAEVSAVKAPAAQPELDPDIATGSAAEILVDGTEAPGAVDDGNLRVDAGDGFHERREPGSDHLDEKYNLKPLQANTNAEAGLFSWWSR